MGVRIFFVILFVFSGCASAGTVTSFSGKVKTLNNCTVNNSAIVVNLGENRVNKMPAIGGTYNEVPFDISLDCKAGAAVKMMIDPPPFFFASNGAIYFDMVTGAASGVMLQLLFKKTRAFIIPGKLYDVDTTSTQGNYDIPLIARYMIMGFPRPGITKTTLTFTLQYN